MKAKTQSNASLQRERLKVLEECQYLLLPHDIYIDIKQICGPSRTDMLIFRRALIVYILRQRGFTLTRIGELLDRDHTTIINLRKYADKKKKRFDYVKREHGEHRYIMFEKFEQITKQLKSGVFNQNISKRIAYLEKELKAAKAELNKPKKKPTNVNIT